MTKKWSSLAILLIIVGFIGMAVEGFKFGDDLPAYSHRIELQDGQLKKLMIDSDYGIDLEFVQSNNGENYVELSGNMQQETIDKLKSLQPNGDTLDLNLKEKFRFQFFTISFKSTKQHITVALSDPKQLEQFECNLHSDNGTITGVKADEAKIVAESGDLELKNTQIDKLTVSLSSGHFTGDQQVGTMNDIKSSSGDVHLTGYTGDAKIEVQSGDFKSEDMKGNVNVISRSGDVTFKGFQGSGDFDVSSGDLRIVDQRSDHLNITSDSGDVTLSADPEFQGFYDLQASSGDVSAPESPQKTKDVIKVRAHSGDVSVED